MKLGTISLTEVFRINTKFIELIFKKCMVDRAGNRNLDIVVIFILNSTISFSSFLSSILGQVVLLIVTIGAHIGPVKDTALIHDIPHTWIQTVRRAARGGAKNLVSRNQYSAQGRIQGVLMRAREGVKAFIRKHRLSLLLFFFCILV